MDRFSMYELLLSRLNHDLTTNSCRTHGRMEYKSRAPSGGNVTQRELLKPAYSLPFSAMFLSAPCRHNQIPGTPSTRIASNIPPIRGNCLSPFGEEGGVKFS